MGVCYLISPLDLHFYGVKKIFLISIFAKTMNVSNLSLEEGNISSSDFQLLSSSQMWIVYGIVATIGNLLIIIAIWKNNTLNIASSILKMVHWRGVCEIKYIPMYFANLFHKLHNCI